MGAAHDTKKEPLKETNDEDERCKLLKAEWLNGDASNKSRNHRRYLILLFLLFLVLVGSVALVAPKFALRPVLQEQEGDTCGMETDETLKPAEKKKSTVKNKIGNVIKKPFQMAKSTITKRLKKKRKQHNNSQKKSPAASRTSQLTSREQQILDKTKVLIQQNIPDFERRAKKVKFGGDKVDWHNDDLVASFLLIMNYPDDLRTNYPYSICKHKSERCSTHFAFANTLEFRETKQPWRLSEGALNEAQNGLIYHYGFTKHESAVVWFKVGSHELLNSEAYSRLVGYTLERAIVESLKVSNGRVGRVTMKLDLQGFSRKCIPSLSDVKKFFVMLMDHNPDRLSEIHLVNLSTPAKIVMNLVLPLLSDVVKKKIYIVDKEENWGYGYEFDPKQYFKGEDIHPDHSVPKILS